MLVRFVGTTEELDNKSRQQKTECVVMVQQVAESIVEGFLLQPDKLLSEYFKEKIGGITKEFLNITDAAILYLVHSRNPSAGLIGNKIPDYHLRSDNFPFESLAKEAFVADVYDEVRRKLGDEHHREHPNYQPMFDIRYRCPTCGYEWEERYSAACDSECGKCDTDAIQAVMWKDAGDEWSKEQNRQWCR